MIAAIATSKTELPTDPEKLRSYSWDLTLAYQQLTEKYNKVLGTLYGRSSEKRTDIEELDALQVEMDELLSRSLAIEEQLTNAESPPGEEETVEVTVRRRRRRKSGRNSIPEELITDVIVDIAESEKICQCCGETMTVFDTKPHIVVERIPAEYKATRYIRPVYGCSHCKDTTKVAEPVHLPISKGLAGLHLLLFVILSKYHYHLPLYRIQRQIFHESQIWFTRSTLVSWVRHVCGLLERIHRGLLTAYRSSRIKHADETPFQVQWDAKYHTAYMWVGITGDSRTAVFLFNRHRSGQSALKLLEGSSPGDFLMVDDCPSYNKAVKKLKLRALRCMVHIRRKFFEAFKSGHKKEFNNKVLIKIGQLYRIERFANKHNLEPDKRLALRTKYSKPIMDQIKALLYNPGFPILPQTDTGGAIRYFLNNWQEATRFLDSGDLPIDNSVNERIIRQFTLGRNNWGHAGSEQGAHWMAILYSIITTCKLNSIDPQKYLEDILMRLTIRPPTADISDLLPIQWYKNQNNGKMPELQTLYPFKD